MCRIAAHWPDGSSPSDASVAVLACCRRPLFKCTCARYRYISREEAHARVEAQRLVDDYTGTVETRKYMTASEVDQFFDQTDTNGDGRLSFGEYKKLWIPPEMLSFPMFGTRLDIPRTQRWRLVASCAVVFIFVPVTSYVLGLPVVWAAAALVATVVLAGASFALATWLRGGALLQ